MSTSSPILYFDPERSQERKPFPDYSGLFERVAAKLPYLAAARERERRELENREGQAHALCGLAHARRLGGDLSGAEQALSEAMIFACCAGEEAELGRALALLRWEQGRMLEARALLVEAEALWADDEEPHEEAACRVLRALLAVEKGRAPDAVELLHDGLPLLVDPGLHAYG